MGSSHIFSRKEYKPGLQDLWPPKAKASLLAIWVLVIFQLVQIQASSKYSEFHEPLVVHRTWLMNCILVGGSKVGNIQYDRFFVTLYIPLQKNKESECSSITVSWFLAFSLFKYISVSISGSEGVFRHSKSSPSLSSICHLYIFICIYSQVQQWTSSFWSCLRQL